MDLEKGEIKGVINFIDVFITFLEIARSHPVSEFRTSFEYNASTRIPQFLPAIFLYSCIPVPCGRYTTKLRSCNTRATILDGIWIKKKEKKREISAPTNFFPRKERKMFRAFSKSGASLNHPNYILRERRKGNGVIFIFVSLKKKKKKHCHTRLTDVRMRLALISIHCVNQVFLPGYFHGGGEESLNYTQN